MIGQRDVYESAMVKSLSKSAAAMQIEQFRESIYYYCERVQGNVYHIKSKDYPLAPPRVIIDGICSCGYQNYMGLLCRHQIAFRAAQNLFPSA